MGRKGISPFRIENVFDLPVIFLKWRLSNGDVVLFFNVGPDPVKGVTFVHQRRIETTLERHILADSNVHSPGTGRQQRHHQKSC